MIVEHGVDRVVVLQVYPDADHDFREDPDWLGDGRALYTTQPIPPSEIGRVVAEYDRSDFD